MRHRADHSGHGHPLDTLRAGGIKITTFLVLGFSIWNEVRGRGRDEVTIAHRSISASSQRRALSVALLGVAAVVGGTLLLMLTDYSLEKSCSMPSAFATVGVSTGTTYNLPPSAEWVLMALMFTGRNGTVAVASALALSSRPRLYRLPEERPIIG